MEIGPWGDANGSPPVAEEPHHRWGIAGPHCAICAGGGLGTVTEHHLTHGVSVNLCHHHQSEHFQTLDGGQEFVHALRAVWAAAGCLTRQREQALDAHTRRIRNAVKTERQRPGSYTWPRMREEAERRWSEGQNRLRVMYDLRRLHAGSSAIVPSMRTMRRWHTEARWLDPPPRDAPPSLGERALATIADFNREGREMFGATALPGWPERDRWDRPYRRR